MTTKENWKTVGRLKYNENDIIGHSRQIYTFRGKYEDTIDVAIKRAQKGDVHLEIKILKENHVHPNIIHYYVTEEDDNFNYIAMESCPDSLEKYIKRTNYNNNPNVLEISEYLRQATCGLKYLHQKGIVHRKITPHNILISETYGDEKPQIKLTDFAVSRERKEGRADFTASGLKSGSHGWIAPEILEDGTERYSSQVDIFSLGCVICYALTGKHPFGEDHERDANILNGNLVLPTNLNDVAVELITSMLKQDPIQRPSAQEVYDHPFFKVVQRSATSGPIQILADIFDSSNIKLVDGEGSFNSEVREVIVHGQKRACKRIKKEPNEDLVIEINSWKNPLLNHTDKVVRFYEWVENPQYCYIMMEKCDYTLREYILASSPNSIDNRSWKQIIVGLEYLHHVGIVHRNIKPSNILMVITGNDKQPLFKLTDFGKSKFRSVGWTASEVAQENFEETGSVDVFAAGCSIFYGFTFGKHPFVSSNNLNYEKCQENINAKELPNLQPVDWIPTFEHLISIMINHIPEDRRKFHELLSHPFFMSAEEALKSVEELSKNLEENSATVRDVVQMLETNKDEIFDNEWKTNVYLTPGVLGYIDGGRRNPSRGDSVRHLLRAIRNKSVHYHTLSKMEKEEFGIYPNEYWNYWSIRFPKLINYVWLAKMGDMNKISSSPQGATNQFCQ